MQQVSVLETNIGSSTTGNSANTEIIFNDAGTLRGDAGLTYNKTTDALTITGDLTVDTSTLKVDSANDRVGFGTASPAQFVHFSKSNTSTALTSPPVGNASLRIQNTSSTNNNFGSVEFYNAAGLFGASVNCQYTNQATPTNDLVFVTRGSSGGLEHYRIAADGVATWSEVGGTSGTAMTLNATGLGVGTSPAVKGHFYSASGSNELRLETAATGAGSTNRLSFKSASGAADARTGAIEWYDVATFKGDIRLLKAGGIQIRNSADSPTFNLDDTGNVGIGVTPSAWATVVPALQIGTAGGYIAAQGSAEVFRIGSNSYYNAGFKYVINGFSSRYDQASGTHAWYTAPSGTAGASAAVTSGQSYTVSVLGSSTLAQWQAFFSALTVLPTVGQVIAATATGSIVGGGTVTQNITFTQAMTLDASGNLLVGTTSTLAAWATKLVLSTNSGTTKWAVGPYADPNNFIISASGSFGVYLNGTSAVSWTGISDERLKDIIEPISNAVAKVGHLRSVIGKFKSDETNTRRSFLLAQDVQAVLPEAVDASNPDRLGVAYTDVIPLLVAAIKELTARVQTLEAK